MAILVNRSYSKCIVGACNTAPNFAIIIEDTGHLGRHYRVATILTCSEHIDEGDAYAKEHYGDFSREIFDNPGWLKREQRAETGQEARKEFLRSLNW